MEIEEIEEIVRESGNKYLIELVYDLMHLCWASSDMSKDCIKKINSIIHS